jgi:hypothetical protein
LRKAGKGWERKLEGSTAKWFNKQVGLAPFFEDLWDDFLSTFSCVTTVDLFDCLQIRDERRAARRATDLVDAFRNHVGVATGDFFVSFGETIGDFFVELFSGASKKMKIWASTNWLCSLVGQGRCISIPINLKMPNWNGSIKALNPIAKAAAEFLRNLSHDFQSLSTGLEEHLESTLGYSPVICLSLRRLIRVHIANQPNLFLAPSLTFSYCFPPGSDANDVFRISISTARIEYNFVDDLIMMFKPNTVVLDLRVSFEKKTFGANQKTPSDVAVSTFICLAVDLPWAGSIADEGDFHWAGIVTWAQGYRAVGGDETANSSPMLSSDIMLFSTDLFSNVVATGRGVPVL